MGDRVQAAGRGGWSAVAWLFAGMVVVVALVVPGSALAGSGAPALVGSISGAVNLSGATSVAVSGHYAYTTVYYAGRVTAIDISNPAQPTIAGSSPFANSLLNASTVNIVGGYAYVASKNANGASGSNSNDNGSGNSLTILDIGTNPAQPSIVGSVTNAVDLFGAYGVAVSGSYAYVAAQGCLTGQPCPNSNVGNSFVVVDISSPSTPKVVAKLHNQSLPSPWTGSGALNHACSVAVAGNYAYVTAAYSNRLTVIDISNPLSPTIVASLQDSNQLSFDVDVAVRGGYAYVADQASGLGRLAVVDVHNPTTPVIAGSVTNSTWLNGAYRVRVRGNFAYVSGNSANAVAAVDISDPTNPRFAGGYSSGASLSHTTGLDLDSTGRFLIATSPFLATESQAIYPPYPLQGGPTATGTVSVIDLDPSPIAVTIAPSSEPANPTVLSSASFTFSVSDPVSTVQCQLDRAPFGPCSSSTSQAYSSLGVGSHTFTVQATDAAGNTAASSYTWVISQSSGSSVGPTTPVLDNFNRANGGVGSGWSNIKVASGFAGMNISGHAAVDSSATQYAWNYWNGSSFGPDCEAYVTVSSYGASDTIRIGARVTGGTNAYSGYFVSVASGGAWSIIRIDNGGSQATLASGVTQAIGNGDKIGIRIVGSVVTALDYNSGAGWTQVLSYNTASDGVRYTAAGSLALEFRSGTIDDFGGGTVVLAPAITSLPSLSGTATVGQLLTASSGVWQGVPTPTYSFGWQRCDSGGNNCVAISGASGSAYTLVGADAGSTLEVVVTASNSAGQASATSAPSSVVGAGSSAPSITSLPSLSGTATVGQLLTASSGVWQGVPTPTYSFGWQRCDSGGNNCVAISGASGSAYTLVGADAGSTLEVVVTASNSAGQASATSAPSSVVGAGSSAPSITSLPSLSGTATVGQLLTASSGVWQGVPTPTYSFGWQRCDSGGNNCVAISGASGSAYTLVGADAGSTLEVVVTASNSAGQASATSAPSSVVGAGSSAPSITSLPSLSGTATVGQLLTASSGVWQGVPTPTYSFGWQRCDSGGNNCVAISGASGSAYTLVGADAGSTLEVVVTASNSAGQASATSAPSSVVGAGSSAPSITSLPSLSGTATVGQLLTASSGVWQGVPTPTYSFGWQRCDSGGNNCVAISGASGSAYTLVGADAGSTLEVVVTASNSAGQASATSAPSSVVGAGSSAPSITSLPSLSGTATVGQLLTASSGVWQGVPTPTYSFGWQRCDSGGNNCVAISGASGSAYTLVGADAGSTLEVVVTASNSAGQASATSAPSSVVGAGSSAPSITSLPSLSGTATVGQLLTASSGVWQGVPTPTYSFGWQRCDSGGNNCVAISGASGSAYTLVGADAGSTLEVVVTASNSAGQASATSAPSSVVGAGSSAPSITSLPSLSGTATVGQLLTASSGVWQGVPTPTYSFGWQRCDSGGNNCVAISGASGSAYTLVGADAGSTLEVVVTASNSAGQASATSAPSSVVGAGSSAPSITSLPSLSGTATVGQLLTASSGVWQGVPTPTYSFGWQRCDSGGNNCVAISGASGSAYTLVGADAGSTLEVVVTASNSAGQASATSAPSSVVGAGSSAPSITSLPSLSGTATVG